MQKNTVGANDPRESWLKRGHMAQGEKGDSANPFGWTEPNLQRVWPGVSALPWIRHHGPTEGFPWAM